MNGLILPKLKGAKEIEWLSPLAADDFAEYRDDDFLRLVGAGHLASELEGYWPRRGPQWDALARTDADVILLVEAKAHIDELCSPPSQAGPTSREAIIGALNETATALGAQARAPWSDVFYQLANRFAHLHFLRKHGQKAWLVLVNFTGDAEMGGPASVQPQYRSGRQHIALSGMCSACRSGIRFRDMLLRFIRR